MIRILREVEGKIEEGNDLSLPGIRIQLITITAEELHQVSLGTGLLLDFLAAALDPEEPPPTGCGRRANVGDHRCANATLGDGSPNPAPGRGDQSERNRLRLSRREPVFFLRPRLGVHPEKKTRLLLQLLYCSADLYLEAIKKLNARTGMVEKTLRRSMKNEQMFQLMESQQSLGCLFIAVKANEILLEELLHSCLRQTEERRNLTIPIHLFPEDEDLLEDTITEYQQAIYMAEIHSGILTAPWAPLPPLSPTT